MIRVIRRLVTWVWGECAWHGHDGEWVVVESNGFVRQLEFECARCGLSDSFEEAAGDRHRIKTANSV